MPPFLLIWCFKTQLFPLIFAWCSKLLSTLRLRSCNPAPTPLAIVSTCICIAKDPAYFRSLALAWPTYTRCMA